MKSILLAAVLLTGLFLYTPLTHAAQETGQELAKFEITDFAVYDENLSLEERLALPGYVEAKH